MEWLTGLALLPALACGLMMGGMVLGGVLGWRRAQQTDTAADVQAGTSQELARSKR